MRKITLVIYFLISCTFFINASEIVVKNPPKRIFKKGKVDYSIWAMILKTSVDKHGYVNYKKLKKEEKVLDKFLNILSETKIDNSWYDSEKIAFWINVYNAFTMKLIVKNYPLNSIKEIDNPWKTKFFKIGGELMSLHHVEHEILRKEFVEPRIHFAINCASKSCPRVIQIPYTSKNLEDLLERQTAEYINNPIVNLINNKSYTLSKLFSWFGKDFRKSEGSVKDFINKYSKVKIDEQKNKGYFSYNWDLNAK